MSSIFRSFAVVVGSGRKLVEYVDTNRLNLKLTGFKQFTNGVVTLTYAKE
jgi:hypothetical protein